MIMEGGGVNGLQLLEYHVERLDAFHQIVDHLCRV